MESKSESCAKRLHGVVVPFPLQGHINPCLSIAKALVPKGFTFTFVVTEHIASKLPSLDNTSYDGSCSIRFVSIPDGLPPSHPRGGGGSGASALLSSLESMHGMRHAFEELLPQFLPPASPLASFILAGSFVTWSHDVASRFRIPWFVFHASNAHALSVVLHSPVLVASGLASAQDPDLIIDSIPGMPPLRARDLPQLIRSFPNFAMDQVKHMHEAAGLVLNTVYDIESRPLDAIVKRGLHVYPIGPSLLMSGSSLSRSGTLALFPEERNCLQWLDTLPQSSVLYVSFGSIATMGVEQKKELAEGLEASGQSFLWVIRPNAADESVSDVLPEGFLDRTKGWGRIISWAPQVEVLSHVSVGGFLTHCGWNSITENLSTGGLPMICWPHGAEQKLNARMLVEEWKIGLELREVEGMVKKGDVECAVKQLMQGEERIELRKKALQLKETACSAVRDGGSSKNYLEAFVLRVNDSVHHT